MTSKPGISVIVCTYNGAERLPQTLSYLCLQKANIDWEIIIVDNDSTDNSYGVAENQLLLLQPSCFYTVIRVFKPGKKYALEEAYKISKYSLLLICDDDNWLNENYIQHCFQIMQNNPKIGALGGRSEAVFETTKPFWFDDYKFGYAVGAPMSFSGSLNSVGYTVGAGMCFRKTILQQLNKISYQPLLTGRKGKLLTSGEDGEFCLLIKMLNYDLYYDENLFFYHFITSRRVKWKYCVNLYSSGLAVPQLYFYMYDYCYKKLLSGEQINFEYTYKRNVRKHAREITNLLNKPRNFFKNIRLLLFSKEGSREEINIKTSINKLLFTLKNRNKLEEDYNTIQTYIQRLLRVAEYTNIAEK